MIKSDCLENEFRNVGFFRSAAFGGSSYPIVEMSCRAAVSGYANMMLKGGELRY